MAIVIPYLVIFMTLISSINLELAHHHEAATGRHSDRRYEEHPEPNSSLVTRAARPRGNEIFWLRSLDDSGR